MLDGSLKETLFDWPSQSEPEKPLNMKAVNTVARNQVAYINGKKIPRSGQMKNSPLQFPAQS